MHSFLRAIGFSKVKSREEINALVKFIKNNPESVVNMTDGFVEIEYEFAKDMGICLRGGMNKDDEFVLDYYFPFARGIAISSSDEVIIEKHKSDESYAGVCEDIKVGVALIFYLQNVVNYKMVTQLKADTKIHPKTKLAALSVSGSIILPIAKNIYQTNHTRTVNNNRSALIAAAKNGDEEAMESLTLDDIDMYAKISRRIRNEDIFSIVDSTFMPYGIECDLYSVLGEILDINKCVNSVTREIVYNMMINCNDIIFQVCINKKDLLGEPAVGRRFKGSIWMQGSVEFR